jgi:hypothetical protein
MVRNTASTDLPDIALGTKSEVDLIEIAKMILPFRGEYTFSTKSL